MSKKDRNLTESIVRQRLASYKCAKVTDEIYDFGKMLIDEVIDRAKTLDTKATAIAAYSIALITFLASQHFANTTAHSWRDYAMAGSGAIAMISAVVAISALWLKRFAWFSPDEWIKADCLDDAERLRRYHIIRCGAFSNLTKRFVERKRRE